MSEPVAIIRSATPVDVEWCAELMANSEPWITLGRDFSDSRSQLADCGKELYVGLQGGGKLVGFVLIDMRGPFVGYIQSLCVAPEFRNKRAGAALLRFAENRIFREYPNVFLCVSSFNSDARRFYEREKYEEIGELRDFIIPGASEILLRKSIASNKAFVPQS